MRLLQLACALCVLMVSGCASMTGSGEPDFERYKACSAEHPPEKVAEKCGKYL